MASALDTIAHVVLPNLMKIKGASTLVGAMERRDVSLFAQCWTAAGVDHTPQVIAKDVDVWRIGVMSLPKPSEMGEAHMCAFVAKKNDPAITRYFTLEYDYVLSSKTERTIVSEREGNRDRKHGDGPPITGDFATDASAFVELIIGVMTRPSRPSM